MRHIVKKSTFCNLIDILPCCIFNNINIHIEKISILSKPEEIIALLGRENGMLANQEEAALACFIDRILS